MKFFLSLFVALALPSMAIAQVPTDTVTVFMIGDSTMADKPLDKENQERGWGQMLPIYLEGAVRVDNHAVNGAQKVLSTRVVGRKFAKRYVQVTM